MTQNPKLETGKSEMEPGPIDSRILEIENIRVRYSGIPILQGVSLSINKGETVCVVGSNGAGHR